MSAVLWVSNPPAGEAASGLVNVAHQFGGSLGLGVLVTISVAAASGTHDARDLLAHRVAASFTAGAAMFVPALALVVALIVDRVRPQPVLVNGPTSAWYRGTRAHHEGRIRAGGVDKDVTFIDADPAINDQIDAAYRSKYGRYAASIVDAITSDGARSATIELVPRT